MTGHGDFLHAVRAAKARRRDGLHRALGVAVPDERQEEEDQAPASNVREQAARDFATLERTGLVIRDDLLPEQLKPWRSAITGAAHANGMRVDTGELKHGVGVWAGLNVVDGPPDTAR